MYYFSLSKRSIHFIKFFFCCSNHIYVILKSLEVGRYEDLYLKVTGADTLFKGQGTPQISETSHSHL